MNPTSTVELGIRELRPVPEGEAERSCFSILTRDIFMSLPTDNGKSVIYALYYPWCWIRIQGESWIVELQ